MSTTRLVLKKVPQGTEIAIVGSMSVGRSEESAVRLLEGKPSRNHAVISTDSVSAFVEDLGSTNGTFINDRRLDAHVKTKLNAGDRVRFDTEEFLFGDAPPAPPVWRWRRACNTGGRLQSRSSAPNDPGRPVPWPCRRR